MLFEIIRDGKVVMHTEHEKCVPSLEILRRMMEAGHSFKIDGKDYKPKKSRESHAKSEK